MATPPSDRKCWRIIATDDNTSKLSALTETLRAAGHCVFAAYDGQSALELVNLLPDVDLLVTDTRLGAVDGPELMQRVRVMHPGLPILHVIHGSDSDGGTPPGVPTLREPFSADQLLSVVERLMGGPNALGD